MDFCVRAYSRALFRACVCVCEGAPAISDFTGSTGRPPEKVLPEILFLWPSCSLKSSVHQCQCDPLLNRESQQSASSRTDFQNVSIDRNLSMIWMNKSQKDEGGIQKKVCICIRGVRLWQPSFSIHWFLQPRPRHHLETRPRTSPQHAKTLPNSGWRNPRPT